MEELIEVLTQIQELAGVAIDALTEAAGGGGAPEGGAPPEAEGAPQGPPPTEPPA
jgi:hypothetical protein